MNIVFGDMNENTNISESEKNTPIRNNGQFTVLDTPPSLDKTLPSPNTGNSKGHDSYISRIANQIGELKKSLFSECNARDDTNELRSQSIKQLSEVKIWIIKQPFKIILNN